MSGSGTWSEAIRGRRKPIRPARRESNSASPSTTADLPVPGSIAVTYTLRAMASACQEFAAQPVHVGRVEALVGQPALDPTVALVDLLEEPAHAAGPGGVLLVGDLVDPVG